MKARASNSPLLRARPARGFTLIELMITVAIVAILAAIAYPSYLDSVLKGRRAEGRTAVLNLLQQQERYYTQTGSYLAFEKGRQGANGTRFPDVDDAQIPFKTWSGETVGSSAYLLQATACTDNPNLNECIVIGAVPEKTDPAAGTLTVSSSGKKSCSVANSPVCWR